MIAGLALDGIGFLLVLIALSARLAARRYQGADEPFFLGIAFAAFIAAFACFVAALVVGS